MLTRPSKGRRVAGRAIVAATAVVALPLTASRATEYVDVPASENVSSPALTASHAVPASAAAAPVTIASASATAAPATGGELPYPDLGGVTLGRNDVAFMADDTVLIGGKRKSLDQLTPAERSRLRGVILKSQRDLARDRARLPQELAQAKREADRARSGELRREHARDIAEMRRDLAEVDSEAADLRANGEDPEKRKAEILRDLREAEATDIAQEEREAIEEGDPNKRIAEIRSEEQQMIRMLARLNQLDRR